MTILRVVLICLAMPSAFAALTVSDIAVSTDTPFVAEVVTFSVVATSTVGTVQIRWNFGDDSTPTTGATATHAYTTENIFIAFVCVDDGVSPTYTDSIIIENIAPPAPNETIGVNTNDVKVNPDNGLATTVTMNQGGVIELLISDTNLSRGACAFETDFNDGLLGRVATSARPRHAYTTQGIKIVTINAKDLVTGSNLGKLRKTFVISSDDIGAPRKVKNFPAKRTLTVRGMTGKFNFINTLKNDAVRVAFQIELPEGLDISTTQDIAISVGNITEVVPVDSRGNGPQTGRFKKVKVRYPKLAKGTTETTVGQTAKVAVQLSAANLSASGFDTEGITSKRQKSQNPKIQIAMLLAGVSYFTEAEVAIRISRNGGTGFLGRVGQ
ncbi:MAG: hypothetical protein V1899_03795 [Planctomycetota bacterium]